MLEHLPPAIGHALRPLRPGLERTAFSRIDLRQGTGVIKVESLGFGDHAPLPRRYTADGEGLSPPLNWSGVPNGTESLVLLVEDADAPAPNPWVHLIVVGLPAESALGEGAIASPDHEGVGLQTGRNAALGVSWLPPDPPPGHGVHRYAFQVFALRSGAEPNFSDVPGHDEVLRVLAEYAIASGCLIGTYERADGSVPSRAAPESVVTETPVDDVAGGALAPG